MEGEEELGVGDSLYFEVTAEVQLSGNAEAREIRLDPRQTTLTIVLRVVEPPG